MAFRGVVAGEGAPAAPRGAALVCVAGPGNYMIRYWGSGWTSSNTLCASRSPGGERDGSYTRVPPDWDLCNLS